MQADPCLLHSKLFTDWPITCAYVIYSNAQTFKMPSKTDWCLLHMSYIFQRSYIWISSMQTDPYLVHVSHFLILMHSNYLSHKLVDIRNWKSIKNWTISFTYLIYSDGHQFKTTPAETAHTFWIFHTSKWLNIQNIFYINWPIPCASPIYSNTPTLKIACTQTNQ